MQLENLLTNSIPEVQWRIHKGYPAESTQFLVLMPIYLTSILIFYSHLRVDRPKGLFPICLPSKMLKAFLPSSILAT